RIAEGLMHDVPEVKDLLRAIKKENALGAGCLFASKVDRVLKFPMSRGQEPAESTKLLSQGQRASPDPGDAKGTRDVEGHHGRQRDQYGPLRHLLNRWQFQQQSEIGLWQQILLP